MTQQIVLHVQPAQAGLLMASLGHLQAAAADLTQQINYQAAVQMQPQVSAPPEVGPGAAGAEVAPSVAPASPEAVSPSAGPAVGPGED